MIKLLAGLWSGIGAMIAAIFALASRKAGVVTASLATMAALLVVFVACINALVQSMIGMIATAESLLLGWFAAFVGMFIPSNFGLVLASIVSARICRAAYDLGRKKTELVAYGN